MKKIYILVAVILLCYKYSYAQCDNAVISTYPPAINGAGQPFPSQNSNPERPDMRNTLNWMLDETFTHDLNNPSYLSIALDNPYYQNNTTIGYVAQPKDFHPEDGWEIIHRGFGLLSNYQSMTTNRHELPFLILYNRFEETLRIFGCTDLQGYDIVAVRLKFAVDATTFSNPIYQNHELSALLSPAGAINQPLDQKTEITHVLSPAQRHPNLVNRWFHADFKVAYDFCQCDFESAIIVEFISSDESDIKLYGRLQATSTPQDLVKKNGSSNPAAFDPDFLSTNNFTSGTGTSGVLTYKNFEKLMDDYDAKLLAYNNNKKDAEAIKTLSTVLTVGAYVATAGKGLFVKKGLGAVLGLTEAKSQDKAAGALIYGLKAAGKYTDYYSQRTKASSKTPSMPSIIQGEMRIEGTLRDDDNTEVTIIGAPGSKNTNNLDEEIFPVYSYYNEHLGLFAMAETPNVELTRYAYNQTYTEYVELDDGSLLPVTYTKPHYRLTFKLAETLKYALNPAAKPDLTSTKILFAVEFETLSLNSNQYDILSTINMERKYADGNILKFRTPFLPAECLESYISEIEIAANSGGGPMLYSFIDETKVKLKAMVVFVSNDLDKQNDPNISSHLYSFPTSFTSSTEDRSTFISGKNTTNVTMPFEAPDDLVLNTQTFSQSQDIYSFGTVTINGTLTAVAGVTVNIYADQGFKTNPGSKLEGPGIINLKIYDPQFTCGPASQPLTVDQNLRNTYCTGTNAKYQANILKSDVIRQQKTEEKEEEPGYQFTLYPNPTKNVAFVRFELEEQSNVELVITDITGKEMAKDISTLSIGEHGKKLDLSQFSAGVYFVNITINGSRNTERLVVVK